MPIRPRDEACRTVAVLLFDRFSNHCLANAVEPLRAANDLSRRRLYAWRHVGIDGAPVRSSSGLPVTPEGPLSRADGGDLLFVMPSYGFRDHAGPQTLRALRAASRRFRVLVGLDTGAWLLAAAGLLDGRRATIHWNEQTALAEAFPEVDVRPDGFVIDGPRMTCGGVTTAFDLVMALIRDHHGPMLAMEVASLFMHGPAPAAADLPASASRQARAAVALMREHLEAPLPVPALAARLGLGRKALARLFQAELGQTAQGVYRALRLREARRLTEQSRHSVAEIAARCGYGDPAAMTRAFRAEFGATPSAVRHAARDSLGVVGRAGPLAGRGPRG